MSSPQCPCAICRHELPFTLDDFLLSQVRAENVIIFAGAGVSTESQTAAPHSLFVELAHHLNLGQTNLPFPDLAQAVADQPDGRFKLLQLIQDRFDYIQKFRDLSHAATRFHNELATMPYFKTFITTNWDRYFEEVCHAKPFTYDSDMRFWEIPYRKVLKVHGTIDDYSSIVATRSDYIECEKRLHTSLIGAKLKDLLTSRTCLFVGYSLRDDDIKEIFSFARNALGKFTKTHYFISPRDPEEPLPAQIMHIRTDGCFFLKTLKAHMCATSCYLHDDFYDHLDTELSELLDDHSEFYDKIETTEHPQAIINGAYQDGLIHGYKRIIDSRGVGRFSDLHAVQSLAHNYETKIASCRRAKHYIDAAYFKGYQNTLLGLIFSGNEPEEFEFAPRFYHEKIGEMHEEDYWDTFESLPEVHKAAFAECKRVIAKWNLGPGIIFQHMPWG